MFYIRNYSAGPDSLGQCLPGVSVCLPVTLFLSPLLWLFREFLMGAER